MTNFNLKHIYIIVTILKNIVIYIFSEFSTLIYYVYNISKKQTLNTFKHLKIC